MTDRDRARSLVEALMAEEAAADRARFRDVEATGRVCLREWEMGPGSLTGDGWAMFVLFGAVLLCGTCPRCVDDAWAEAMRTDD